MPTNSCNAASLSGAAGSATPAMQCLTASRQRALQLLQCTALTTWGQWAVERVQCTATLPGGTTTHCLWIVRQCVAGVAVPTAPKQ